jgi:hypothetical protein
MMHWETVTMPLLNEPLETRLVLSKAEKAALRRASNILASVREKIEVVYGKDDAIDLQAASEWIYAECHLYEALDELRGQAIVLPPH